MCAITSYCSLFKSSHSVSDGHAPGTEASPDVRCVTTDVMRAGRRLLSSGSLAAIPSSFHVWLRFRPYTSLPSVGSAITIGLSHSAPPSSGTPSTSLCNQSVKAPGEGGGERQQSKPVQSTAAKFMCVPHI